MSKSPKIPLFWEIFTTVNLSKRTLELFWISIPNFSISWFRMLESVYEMEIPIWTIVHIGMKLAEIEMAENLGENIPEHVYTEYLVWFFSSEYKKCCAFNVCAFQSLSERSRLFISPRSFGLEERSRRSLLPSSSLFTKLQIPPFFERMVFAICFIQLAIRLEMLFLFKLKKNIDKRFVTQMHCVNGLIYVCVCVDGVHIERYVLWFHSFRVWMKFCVCELRNLLPMYI